MNGDDVWLPVDVADQPVAAEVVAQLVGECGLPQLDVHERNLRKDRARRGTLPVQLRPSETRSSPSSEGFQPTLTIVRGAEQTTSSVGETRKRPRRAAFSGGEGRPRRAGERAVLA